MNDKITDSAAQGVKPWRERLKEEVRQSGHEADPQMMMEAMHAEIADLRAQLAKTEANLQTAVNEAWKANAKASAAAPARFGESVGGKAQPGAGDDREKNQGLTQESVGGNTDSAPAIEESVGDGSDFTQTFSGLIGQPFAQQLGAGLGGGSVGDDELPLPEGFGGLLNRAANYLREKYAPDSHQWELSLTLDKAANHFYAHMTRKLGGEAGSIDCQEFHELAMDYRAAILFGSHEAYEKLVAYIDTNLALAYAKGRGSAIADYVNLNDAALAQARAAGGSVEGIDLDKLESLARGLEAMGEWDFDTAETPVRIAGGEVVGGDALPYGDVYTVREWETPDGSECLTIAQEVGAQYGRYIAAFDPPTVLKLIAAARLASGAGKPLDVSKITSVVREGYRPAVVIKFLSERAAKQFIDEFGDIVLGERVANGSDSPSITTEAATPSATAEDAKKGQQ